MNAIETLLFEISKFFLAPVLVLLCAMFVFALFEAGRLAIDVAMGARRRRPLAEHAQRHPEAGVEQLELLLLKRIEWLRIVSRVAPMLGLVATMIPMGPALIAVTSGNAQGVAQNLVVAFSAVIVALLAASITFVVLSLRRRWLLEELHGIQSLRALPEPMPLPTGVAHG